MGEEHKRRAHRRAELAEQLQISLRKLDDLIKTKELASFRIGKAVLVSEEALQRFIQKREREAR